MHHVLKKEKEKTLVMEDIDNDGILQGATNKGTLQRAGHFKRLLPEPVLLKIPNTNLVEVSVLGGVGH